MPHTASSNAKEQLIRGGRRPDAHYTGDLARPKHCLSVSSLIKDYYGISDVCFSLPTVVDRSGIEKVIRLELTPDELERLRHSAEVLRKTASSLEL